MTLLIYISVVEIYLAVNYLKRFLNFTYTFPNTVRGNFRKIYLPELQLISLVVIATKLFYPLDDLKRYPVSLREPGAQVMDWDNWLKYKKQYDNRSKKEGKIGKGKEIKMTESDVFRMNPQQLDEYMDWYEKLWIAGESKSMSGMDTANLAEITFY